MVTLADPAVHVGGGGGSENVKLNANGGVSGEGTEGGLGGLRQENFEYKVL